MGINDFPNVGKVSKKNSLRLANGIHYEDMSDAQQHEDIRIKPDDTVLINHTLPRPWRSRLCDNTKVSPRPLVPLCMWTQVFESVHGLSYPGIRATTD